MKLYILRHAVAEEHGARFPDDRQRPLTVEGEKEMFQVAAGMLEMNLNFDRILSSPFLRARRTAEIVAEVFKFKNLQLTPNLASDGNVRNLIKELNDPISSAQNILLVGHEPYLSRMISLLTSGGEMELRFKKASLCKLTVHDLYYGRCATLEWLLQPGHLKQIGKR